MWRTCNHPLRMPTMIQIRNLPDGLHGTLKGRGAQSRMPLSDYQLSELRAIADKPTPNELPERIAGRASATLVK